MEQMNQRPATPNDSHIYTWIFVIVVLVMIGGLWYYLAGSATRSTSYSTKTSYLRSSQSATAAPTVAIASDADLQTHQDELDNTDLNAIDTTLNQNDADSAQL